MRHDRMATLMCFYPCACIPLPPQPLPWCSSTSCGRRALPHTSPEIQSGPAECVPRAKISTTSAPHDRRSTLTAHTLPQLLSPYRYYVPFALSPQRVLIRTRHLLAHAGITRLVPEQQTFCRGAVRVAAQKKSLFSTTRHGGSATQRGRGPCARPTQEPLSARARVSLPGISLARDARRDALTEATCTEHVRHPAHD